MNPARTKSFAFPFPVADTESRPVIKWDSYTLHLQFTDHMGNACAVEFSDVSHFEFLVEDELDSSIYKYDGVVEVIKSPIIERLIKIGDISKNEAMEFHHIVVGFNEIGSYLVIVFRDLKTK